MSLKSLHLLTAIVLAISFSMPLAAQKLPAGPQVLSFFSDLDDSEQPYGLYLPKNFDEKKKYPLVVMLHGAGSNHRLALRRVFGKSNAPGETDVEASRYFPAWPDVEYIVVSSYARGTAGYQGFREKDVYDMLDDVKKRFKIDEDRIYLTGLSMGGGGTLWLGLTRPDIWAAIAPVCPAPPPGTIDLAPNATNYPLHFFHGDVDAAVPVQVSRDWVKKLKELGAKVEYKEYPGVNHNSWENAYADGFIFEWFSKFRRDAYPSRVQFVSSQYKYDKAWWVQFNQFTPGTLASIDARFTTENQIEVKTTNLTAFTLHLKNHPQVNKAPGKSLQITVDGKKLTVSAAMQDVGIVHQGGAWTLNAPAAKAKHVGAEGPFTEAFATRHVYVYGTQGNPSEEEQKRRTDIALAAADWSYYRGEFLGRVKFFPRIIADKEVRPSDIESCNLILFGDASTNSVIKQFENQLPLSLDSTAAKEYGLAYIFPLNNHYVVVNSGLPWWEGANIQGWRFLPLAQHAAQSMKDFILFRGGATNVVSQGYFDADWKLPEIEAKNMKTAGVIHLR